MRLWDKFALASIVVLSLALRLRPAFGCALWGEDSGEYVYLVKRVVETGVVSFDYTGWGITYPYFPGLYILDSALVELCGFPIITTVGYFVPAFASFSSILIYLIVRRIGAGALPGLTSSALWAVAMPIAYPTSFPIPGAIGGFLLLLSMLLYLKSKDDNRFYVLLIPSTIALVLTHHLSTYFFFIAIFFSFFAKNLIAKARTDDLYMDIAYIAALLTIAFGYWMFVAIPFRDSIVSDAFDVPAFAILALAYLVLPLALGLVAVRRRFAWTYRPSFPDVAKMRIMLSIGFASAIVACSYLLISGRVPATYLPVTPLHLAFSLPTLAIILIAFVGLSFAEYYRDGFFVYTWLIAYVLSFFVAVLTNNQVLLPFRHMQYIMEPVCIFSGLGVSLIFKFLIPGRTSEGKMTNVVQRNAVSALVIAIIISSACMSIPPQEINGGFVDGTSPEEVDAAFWVEHTLPESSTFVSDHRMCSMLFGIAGVNQTGDRGKDLLLPHEFEKEKWGNHSTTNGRRAVDHALIDDSVVSGISGQPWEDAPKMDKGARAKFDGIPFVKLYEANDITIYRVDYSLA